MMKAMKKILILACVFAIGCGGMTESKVGSISLNLPSGWVNGIGSKASKVVSVRVIPKIASDTLATIVPEIEAMLDNPASHANQDGSLGFSGVCKLPYNQMYVVTKNFSMSGRDLEIEKLRIEKTGNQSNVDSLEIAKINVREQALMLEHAFESGMMPTESEINDEIKATFDQAQKAGMPKESFLSNWGISEDEFRYQVVQKLAYMKVLAKATVSAKSDKEYGTLANKLKNDLMNTMEHKVNELSPEKIDVIAKDLGNVFVIVSLFGEPADGQEISDSIKVSGNPSSNEIYNFSDSD